MPICSAHGYHWLSAEAHSPVPAALRVPSPPSRCPATLLLRCHCCPKLLAAHPSHLANPIRMFCAAQRCSQKMLEGAAKRCSQKMLEGAARRKQHGVHPLGGLAALTRGGPTHLPHCTTHNICHKEHSQCHKDSHSQCHKAHINMGLGRSPRLDLPPASPRPGARTSPSLARALPTHSQGPPTFRPPT